MFVFIIGFLLKRNMKIAPFRLTEVEYSYWFGSSLYPCYHTARLSSRYVESQRFSVLRGDCRVVRINYVYPNMFSVCNFIEADALRLDRTAGCTDLSGV